eukprot:2679857-Amphidinium_carterae.1
MLQRPFGLLGCCSLCMVWKSALVGTLIIRVWSYIPTDSLLELVVNNNTRVHSVRDEVPAR